MTWTASSPDPVDGPLIGADRPTLEGYLGFQRMALLNVCAGLTGEQLALRSVRRRTCPCSASSGT